MAIDQLGVSCQYDVFHDRIVVDGHETGISGDVVENLENVALKVRHAVLTKFGFDPGSQHLFDAIKMRCLDRIFDPVRDYLDSLQWDGEPSLTIGLFATVRRKTQR